MRHSLDMTLALARLVDGHDRVVGASDRLGARRAILGVLIALLHDSGYLKRTSEAEVDNGAVFTKVHVSRSADFIAAYLPKIGFAAEAQVAARLVHFTGYEMDIDDIRVDDARDRTLGCMVGAADLIGQMSDRMYLEKVHHFLYEEFVWGSIAREVLPHDGMVVGQLVDEGKNVLMYATHGLNAAPVTKVSNISRNLLDDQSWEFLLIEDVRDRPRLRAAPRASTRLRRRPRPRRVQPRHPDRRRLPHLRTRQLPAARVPTARQGAGHQRTPQLGLALPHSLTRTHRPGATYSRAAPGRRVLPLPLSERAAHSALSEVMTG